MKPITLVICILSGMGAVDSHAQSAKVSAPKQREEIIKQATNLMAPRGQEVSIPEKIVNPFIGQVPERVEEVAEEVIPLPQINERDLLVRVAGEILVSGTASLGGETILLMGQKKLKVGDIIRINFEGESHELLLTDISATTFTVKRGNILYTRALRPARR